MEFPNVTLLITHYNRSQSLEQLLTTINALQLSFGDIVVSDDGSAAKHARALTALEKKFGFRLITTPVNKGLGHNLNKGQDAVRTPYTLYVQEDFIPHEAFGPILEKSLSIMEKRSDLDIVRYYAYLPFPYLKPFDENFGEMFVPLSGIHYTKIYAYSDHPHLRRSDFLTKFGRYAEGLKGDRTEYKMCISFIQCGGKGLFYRDFKRLFTQANSISEPSTMHRVAWRQSKNLLISVVRDFYRQIKYNLDILFMRP
ncbi:glycosyltransferase [Parapedobacter sp. ISTM3]|uniref:glycosyltransferase family 2 protein n=1 Tax=Parapedobacter sp. ISTM3 TaxID=2800130 RepID=UPI0019067B49|nr:glycosyltransferase [Parapedobacter sp. ISTM3]MBK1439217.1 glycosyltransferase [Parapedobacter sp. ISTM3]